MLNESGNVYTRLTVIRLHHRRKRSLFWLCVCLCGGETVVEGGNLRKGTTRSCGCLNRERSKLNGKNFFKHGFNKHPLYALWRAMLRRCNDSKDISYKYYGGRSIKVCKEWNDFLTFVSDVGERPSIEHSLDRIEGNENYCKKNCRWATAKEQAANRKPLVPVMVVSTQNVGSETTF